MGSLVQIATLCIVTLGAVSSTLAQNCGWEIKFPVPNLEIGESMAYDEARGLCVVLGKRRWSGRTGSSGETWSWDGEFWNLMSVSGPSSRVSQKLVYDSAREVVVLFGGGDGGSNYEQDTWEWDGSQWHMKASTGPSPRGFHAMAYDSVRGVTLLYGGTKDRGNTNNDDTWEWDGNKWERVAQSGPSLGWGVEMAFDAGRGVAVLHGCSIASGEPETWDWDGVAWTQRGAGVSNACLFQELIYDSDRDVVLLSSREELWEYDGTSWTQRSNSRVSGASATFAFAYDSQRSVAVLWASNAPLRIDEWDGAAWSYPERPWLNAVGNPIVFDAQEKVSLIVISPPLGSVMAIETWAWNGEEWNFRTSGGPSPRIGHALAYDNARQVTTLFGGFTDIGLSGETWEWDGQTWTMVSSAGPSPRISAAMSYDEKRGVTVLTGGSGGLPATREVWEWDGNSWTQRDSLPIGFFQEHAMAYDRLRNVTVLTEASRPSSKSTWEYDGQAWTQRSQEGFYGNSMFFSDEWNAIGTLVGGTLWSWDGAAWTERASFGSSQAGETTAAYDAVRGRVVALAGIDVFEYGCSCYADCDESGVLDMLDFLCFQDGFVRGTPEACNCDTSTGAGTCDIFDFLCFQSVFVGGCP